MPSGSPPPCADATQTAAVIGAGLAGMVAARVLSSYFGRVVVVERSARISDPPTPDDQSAPISLACLHSLGRFFPDLSQDFAAGDPVPWRVVAQAIYHDLCQRTNILFLYSTTAIRLIGNPETTRVTGVCVQPLPHLAREFVIDATLTVDARGRQSPEQVWVGSIGFMQTESLQQGQQPSGGFWAMGETPCDADPTWGGCLLAILHDAAILAALLDMTVARSLPLDADILRQESIAHQAGSERKERPCMHAESLATDQAHPPAGYDHEKSVVARVRQWETTRQSRQASPHGSGRTGRFHDLSSVQSAPPKRRLASLGRLFGWPANKQPSEQLHRKL